MNINQYIDHTNLKPFSTENDIIKLCNEAIEYNFASVCVNPYYVKTAKRILNGSKVKVCTVIGFPLGMNKTETKVFETEKALQDGCDEFDLVINVGALKERKYDYIKNEIKDVVAAAKGKTVKIIIESGLLTEEEIITVTQIICETGAHFVKTCTGVGGTGIATVEDVKTIKHHISGDIKIKASAGIKTYNDALALIQAGADRLGTSSGKEIVQQQK